MYNIPSPEELRKYRLKVGLTQSELAKKAKVSQSLIARIESGDIDPRVSTLKRILDVLKKEEKKESIYAKDIMSSPVIYIKPEDTILEASKIMEEHKISQLPVIKNGIQVGCVTEDLLIKVIAKEKNLSKIANKKVEDIMGDGFPVVTKKTELSVISKLLENSQAVLVSERGKIIGIVTKADILKLIKK